MSENNITPLIAGYTLVELLIALVLSSTIALIAVQYYTLVGKLSSTVKKGAIELEEERYVFYFMLSYLTQPGLRLKDPKAELNDLHASGHSDIVATARACFYVSTTQHHRHSTALFFKEHGNPRTELATNISSMQVWYGIKCKNSPNICQYENSQNVAAWEDVASLVIELRREVSLWQSKTQRVYVAIQPR